MAETTYIGTLVEVVCWCGTHHAVPRQLHDHQLRCHNDGRAVPDIFCPLGHAWVPSGTPKVTIERRAREEAQAQVVALKDQLAAANRERKRQEKRSKGGACPCCDRTFVQLARHMASQHPDFPKPGK